MRAASIVIAGLLLLPASVLAAPTAKPWLGFNASWGTYSMSDVNADIQNINAVIAPSGLSMEEINGGVGFGATGGINFPGGAVLGIGYDRLFASSDVGDFSASIKYDFPANAFRALAEYAFASSSRLAPHIGVAGGFVNASGSVSVSVTGSGSVTGDVSGGGPLFEAFVGGNLSTSSPVSIVGSLGYRYAKINEVKISDSIVYNADGSKYSMDYSGLLLRLGLRLTLTN